MGVKGLWSLLNPVARPVQIESLEGKRLAIDSSIWLYQFQSTMRDKDGRVLVNAHVLGFLRRINRLLFHGIKPVFVFDGGAPALKRATIAERKRRKLGAAQSHAKMAEKLLHAQMRRAAVQLAQEAEEKRAARIAARATGEFEESEAIAEDAVYLDELEAGPSRPRPTPPTTTQNSSVLESQTSEPPKKKYKRDRYELPEASMPSYSTSERPDARLATEEELKHFIEDVGPTDIDVESPEFRALPTEVQYEIIGDLRVRSRAPSHMRLVAMLKNAPTALDFSKAQIKQLSKRNALTQQLLTVTDSVGKAHLTIPVRVASERNREYLLVKKSEGEGGGWALGIREGTKDRRIELEPETANDRRMREAAAKIEVKRDSDSDDSDFEVAESKHKVEVDKDLREHRRREILRAIAARYAPAPRRAPDADDPAPTRKDKGKGKAAPLFDVPEDFEFDDLDDVQPTEHDEALALALQQEELGSDEDEPDVDLARALALSRREAKKAPEPVLGSDDSDDFEEVSLVPSAGPSRSNSIPVEVLDSSDEEPEVVEPRPPVGQVDRRAEVIGISDDEEVEEVEPPDMRMTAHPARHAGRPSDKLATTRQARGSTVPSKRSTGPTETSVTRDSMSAESVDIVTLSLEEPPSSPDMEDVSSAPPPLPPLRAPPRPDAPEALSRQPSPPPPRILSPTPAPLVAPSPSPPRRGAPSPSPPPPAAQASDSMDDEEFEEVITEPSRAATPQASGSVTPSDWEPTQPNTLPGPSRLAQPVDHDSDEDSDGIAWSRSPSPVLRKRPSLGNSISAIASSLDVADSSFEAHESGRASGDVSGHASDMASDGEMGAEEMEAEEDEYARFLAQIQNRDLATVRTEIDDEIRILNAQTKAAMRDSDEITQSMVAQIQTLLRHFGIPYITAPMEAEAQCAKLAELNLVDGIITDDSDVFLFGGTACFKNIFNDAKYAECFVTSDIERELSLPRARLIELAYLLGSDYTLGLLGVGPVMALELLANFPGQGGLAKFKEWWLKVQQGTDIPVEADTKWKRSFKKRFSGTLHLGADWPNPLVRDAYFYPQTDESDEPFHWGFPRLAALRTYLHEELSWSISKVDDELTPIVQRIAQRGRGAVPRQGTLLTFFDHSAAAGSSFAPRRRTTANVSKRLLAVIKEFREAEARAAGQDPQGWGEMLAGIDESDPRGKGVGKKGSGVEKSAPGVAAGSGAKGMEKGTGKEGNGHAEDGEGDDEGEQQPKPKKGRAKVKAPAKRAPRKRASRTASAAASEAEVGDEGEEAEAPPPRKRHRTKESQQAL